jgi:hypothetical protein
MLRSMLLELTRKMTKDCRSTLCCLLDLSLESFISGILEVEGCRTYGDNLPLTLDSWKGKDG